MFQCLLANTHSMITELSRDLKGSICLVFAREIEAERDKEGKKESNKRERIRRREEKKWRERERK